MVNLTLKNISDDLHGWLKRRAAANRRSLSAEILFSLETLMLNEPVDPESYLPRVRGLRPPGNERLREEDFDTSGGRS